MDVKELTQGVGPFYLFYLDLEKFAKILQLGNEMEISFHVS